MKKTAISLAVGALMAATGAANAATLVAGQNYTINILADGVSCFTFGNCTTAPAGSSSYMQDNDNDAAAAAGSANPAFGSAIAGDSLSGFMNITTTSDGAGGVNFTVSSFNNDTYIGTAGGFFATQATDTSGMSGSIDVNGNMTLDLTGRTGMAQFFNVSLGEQPWNAGAIHTSGTQNGPAGNLTGIALQMDGTALLVSSTRVNGWDFFDGTPYTEVFSIRMVVISGEPVARNDDTLSTSFNTPLPIDIATDLLGNDQHAAGDTLSLSSFTQPARAGSMVVDNLDGTLTYTPDTGFFGADTFTYTIEDTTPGAPDTATVTINVVDPTNLSSPVANDLVVVTDEDVPLPVDPASDATDADGDTLTVSAFDSITAAGGSVIENGDGTLTYTPSTDYFGADSFNYTVTDGRGRFDSAQVLITVNPINDIPVCANVTGLTTPLGMALTIDVTAELLSTCSDIESSPIALVSTTQPTNGMLAFDGANTLTYTPPPNFIGLDTFTYTATDGTHTVTHNVSISVGKIYGNFTMLDASGATFGGTNDVVASWDGTFNTSTSDTNFNMTFGSDSNYRFFGYTWSAHHIRVFGPGTYSFDTSCSTAQLEAGMADCGGAPSEFLTLTVSPGQIGAHCLFNWNVTSNIDVVLRWDMDGSFDNPAPGALYQGPTGPTPALDAVFEFVSRDVEGDGVPGARMIDGPFIDYRANFNLNFTRSSAGGEAETVVSSVRRPNLGGGCTLGQPARGILSRGDLVLVAGFIGWMGAMAARRRRTPH